MNPIMNNLFETLSCFNKDGNRKKLIDLRLKGSKNLPFCLGFSLGGKKRVTHIPYRGRGTTICEGADGGLFPRCCYIYNKHDLY